MDLRAAYATDNTAEQKGRWFENGDVEFLIARSGNRKYNDLMSSQFTTYKHTLDQKDTPEARDIANDRAEKITIFVMARATLLGWRGLPKKDADGNVIEGAVGKIMFGSEELPYSTDNAARLLALKDFRAFVAAKADDFKNYLEAVKEEDTKNSVPTTTGS
jgi:hypothetical protein